MQRSTFYLMNKFDFTSKRYLKTFTPSQLGRVDFIKRLLASDVDAQALDSNGATPLHYAAAAGTTMSHCDSIVMLLGLGLRDRAGFITNYLLIQPYMTMEFRLILRMKLVLLLWFGRLAKWWDTIILYVLFEILDLSLSWDSNQIIYLQKVPLMLSWNLSNQVQKFSKPIFAETQLFMAPLQPGNRLPWKSWYPEGLIAQLKIMVKDFENPDDLPITKLLFWVLYRLS